MRCTRRGMGPQDCGFSASECFNTEHRRLAVIRRLYQSELPEEAMVAHARFQPALESRLQVQAQRANLRTSHD
jgi:hypothetical protein